MGFHWFEEEKRPEVIYEVKGGGPRLPADETVSLPDGMVMIREAGLTDWPYRALRCVFRPSPFGRFIVGCG